MAISQVQKVSGAAVNTWQTAATRYLGTDLNARSAILYAPNSLAGATFH